MGWTSGYDSWISSIVTLATSCNTRKKSAVLWSESRPPWQNPSLSALFRWRIESLNCRYYGITSGLAELCPLLQHVVEQRTSAKWMQGTLQHPWRWDLALQTPRTCLGWSNSYLHSRPAGDAEDIMDLASCNGHSTQSTNKRNKS